MVQETQVLPTEYRLDAFDWQRKAQFPTLWSEYLFPFIIAPQLSTPHRELTAPGDIGTFKHTALSVVITGIEQGNLPSSDIVILSTPTVPQGAN